MYRLTHSRVFCLITVVSTVLLTFTTLGFSQGFRPSNFNSATSIFIEAPRYIQQELREAERAISEDRMSDAVVRLGDLLQRDPEDATDVDLAGQDFFILSSRMVQRPTRVAKSNLRRARQMIEELPSSALETYELRYGPLARKLLIDAASTRDWETVRDVRRKYFHTKAGFDASLLLAQQELLTGHPLAAALLLEDVVAFPPAVAHLGRTVHLLHASACKLAGIELPKSIPGGAEGGEVKIAGKSEPWPTPDKIEPWIEKRFSSKLAEAGGNPSNYQYLGGRTDRNETDAGEIPLANERWRLETTSTPRETREIQKTAEELLSSGKLPPPSMIPIRVGDHLLMRTTNHVFGVDYRTGKRVWQFPWDSPPTFEDEEALPVVASEQFGANSLLTQRVWNDVPYGQVASDGRRVFVIEDLKEVELASFNPVMGFRGTRRADTTTNSLVALDLPTEGKLQWRLGASADEVGSLSDAFFLGAPLPLDGRLYCIVELAGDILLVCLEPSSGEELWRQQLVAVETGTIGADAIRRVSGATPTYREGVLICPTGAGAIVAIDLVDRMLRWGVMYSRRTTFRPTMNSRSSQVDKTELLQRWHTGNAVVHDKNVYVTPTESDVLMCLDLQTGNRKFSDRRRSASRYMAGVRDGRLILVGSSSVTAINAQDGQPLWTTAEDALTGGEQIIGRGVFGDGSFIVPTSANRLVRLSLKDGKVLERRSTKYPLGNLVAVDGEIISQSPTAVTVAYGEKTLEPWITETLRADPGNFDALVRQAELFIQRGRRQEALKVLDQAGKVEPDSIDVQSLSVAAMLGILRESPADSAELIPRLEELIDSPSEEMEFLGLRIKSAIKQKSLLQAFDFLASLSSLSGADALPSDADAAIIGDQTRQCELGQWIAARVRDVYESADDEQKKQIHDRLTQIVRPKLEASESVLNRVISDFAKLNVDQARKELADRYIKEKGYLNAERVAAGSSVASLSDLTRLSPDRLMMMATAFAKGDLDANAIDVLTELDSRESKEVDAESIALLRTKLNDTIEYDWDTKVALDWESSVMPVRGLRTGTHSPKIRSTQIASGRSFTGWQLVFDGMSLGLRNPIGNIVGLATRRDDKDRTARIVGGLMLLIRPGEVSAVDLYKVREGNGHDAMLWTHRFGGDGASIAHRRSDTSSPFGDTIYRMVMLGDKARVTPREFVVGNVIGDRIFVLQGADLIAMHLKSQEILWRVSMLPPSSAVVSNGEEVAVVSADRVLTFDPVDGRKKGEREWDFGKIYLSAGNHVLSYSQSDDQTQATARVVNPLTGEVLLKTDFLRYQTGTKHRGCAKLLNQRYLVLLDTDGKLVVWDVRDGKELTNTKTLAYPDLLRVEAMELSGRLVVIPTRNDGGATGSQTDRVTTQYGNEQKSCHALISVSLKDGSIQWTREFEKPWGCTLAQPADTPLILLNRRKDSYPGTGVRKVAFDATAVDVRNGEILHERLGTAVSSQANELAAKLSVLPVQGRVVAQIGGEILTYKFGEVDPEPREKEDDDQEMRNPKGAKPADSLDDLFGSN